MEMKIISIQAYLLLNLYLLKILEGQMEEIQLDQTLTGQIVNLIANPNARGLIDPMLLESFEALKECNLVAADDRVIQEPVHVPKSMLCELAKAMITAIKNMRKDSDQLYKLVKAYTSCKHFGGDSDHSSIPKILKKFFNTNTPSVLSREEQQVLTDLKSMLNYKNKKDETWDSHDTPYRGFAPFRIRHRIQCYFQEWQIENRSGNHSVVFSFLFHSTGPRPCLRCT